MSDALRETIDKVSNYILENGLREGDALPSADAMTAELGVSRVAYREAMLYLRGLGVITSKRGSCFRLDGFDPARIFESALPLYMASSENLQEVAELRRVLEVGVIADVATNANADLQSEIDVVLAQMSHLLERNDATMPEFEILEVSFHLLICDASDCDLLKSIMRALFRYICKTPDIPVQDSARTALERTFLEHELIASAIRLNDGETALMAMRRHLSNGSLPGKIDSQSSGIPYN